jgi:hypothetical protein
MGVMELNSMQDPTSPKNSVAKQLAKTATNKFSICSGSGLAGGDIDSNDDFERGDATNNTAREQHGED